MFSPDLEIDSLNSAQRDTSFDWGHFLTIMFSNGLVPAKDRGLVAEAIIHSRGEKRIKANEKEQGREGFAS